MAEEFGRAKSILVTIREQLKMTDKMKLERIS